MDFDLVLKFLVSIVPVVAFLLVFSRLDVFDFLSLKVIAALLLAGAGAAVLSLTVNGSLIYTFSIETGRYSFFFAPVVEELFKALPIIILFHHNRLGYKLDAGISGFAIGAGFAMIENMWFLTEITDSNLSTWLVRGFGTAIMHGGTTAIFSLIGHEMTERQAESGSATYSFRLIYFVPGILVAILIHFLFNYFVGQPLVTMLLTLLLVPLVLFLTFAFNEQAISKWLKDDSEKHRQALDDIESGKFAESKDGLAIRKIMERSILGNIDDVFAYILLMNQLILRAEELILASHDDEEIDAGEAEVEMFERLMLLEGRIGPITLMSIEPHLGFSRNDIWEFNQLRIHVERLLD